MRIYRELNIEIDGLFFLQIRAHDELQNLTVIAQGLVEDIMADLRSTESLSVMSSSNSASSLVHHLCSEGYQLVHEVQNDQLLLDIMQGIQTSFDVAKYVFIQFIDFK